MKRPCAWILALLCSGSAWGCGDPAARRSAMAASEGLRRGLSVAGVIELAERVAAEPDSWAVGTQECDGTSDVFAVDYSAATARYVLIAIDNADSHAEEHWRKEFATRELLISEIEHLPVTRCRRAKMSFGQEWVIAATLDDGGRVLEAKPPYQLD
jgi:hypothetical protein